MCLNNREHKQVVDEQDRGMNWHSLCSACCGCFGCTRDKGCHKMQATHTTLTLEVIKNEWSDYRYYTLTPSHTNLISYIGKYLLKSSQESSSLWFKCMSPSPVTGLWSPGTATGKDVFKVEMRCYSPNMQSPETWPLHTTDREMERCEVETWDLCSVATLGRRTHKRSSDLRVYPQGAAMKFKYSKI